MKLNLCLIPVATLMLLSTATASGQDSNRLGFSPEDKKRFDQAVAEGDFLVYVSIGLIVVVLFITIVGLIYYARKRRVQRTNE